LRARSRRILQREPASGQGPPYAPAAQGRFVPPVRALYSAQRYNELKRIHAENLRIVQRIQSKRPIISIDAMERDYEQSRKYKEMISLFGESRISRGSSVVPTPRDHYTQRPRPRPASATVHRAGPPPGRPSSAGATLMRRRQVEASAYKAASHERQRAEGMPTSVWSEDQEQLAREEDVLGTAGSEPRGEAQPTPTEPSEAP
jgi:hypothetical protein